jgi:Ca-activated chloride channel family protein
MAKQPIHYEDLLPGCGMKKRASKPLFLFFGPLAICCLLSNGQARQNTPSGRAIRIDVSMVVVPVLVTDARGNSVEGLTAADFHVFENGREQKIDRLISEDEPFYVALMLDTSGSAHFKLEKMQQAAASFVDSLRAQDQILVASFDSEMRMSAGFSSDRNTVRQAIASVRAESALTRINEALDLMRTILLTVPGRKIIVLFSDGVDNISLDATESDVLKSFDRSDVVLYAVQYDTRKDRLPNRFPVVLPPGYPSFNNLYQHAVKYLSNLTARSGGLLLPADTLQTLNSAFLRIAGEMPRQYALCYYPDRNAKKGAYCRIQVRMNRPGLTIRTRAGYRR